MSADIFGTVPRSNLRVVTEVARSLDFSPTISAMADSVVAAISAAATSYNAVHLRIEKDARDWSQIMGGPEAVWNAYVASMRQAGFTSDVPMYVASGLLTYGASDGAAPVFLRFDLPFSLCLSLCVLHLSTVSSNLVYHVAEPDTELLQSLLSSQDIVDSAAQT